MNLADMEWGPYPVYELSMWRCGRLVVLKPSENYAREDFVEQGNYFVDLLNIGHTRSNFAEGDFEHLHYNVDPLMAQCLVNHYLLLDEVTP